MRLVPAILLTSLLLAFLFAAGWDSSTRWHKEQVEIDMGRVAADHTWVLVRGHIIGAYRTEKEAEAARQRYTTGGY